jgi:hypothetical protein
MSSDNTPETDGPASERGRPKPARGGVPILSILALLVALATAGYVIYRDPPWGRLGKYSFSTPEQALRSDMKMEANGDIHALIELNAKLDRKQLREKLNSLDVKRTADYKGKTALFIQYKSTDKETKQEKERKEVVWYEKEETTGYWRRTYVSSMEVRTSDEKLAKEIEQWGSSGMGFGGPGN